MRNVDKYHKAEEGTEKGVEERGQHTSFVSNAREAKLEGHSQAGTPSIVEEKWERSAAAKVALVSRDSML